MNGTMASGHGSKFRQSPRPFRPGRSQVRRCGSERQEAKPVIVVSCYTFDRSRPDAPFLFLPAGSSVLTPSPYFFLNSAFREGPVNRGIRWWPMKSRQGVARITAGSFHPQCSGSRCQTPASPPKMNRGRIIRFTAECTRSEAKENLNAPETKRSAAGLTISCQTLLSTVQFKKSISRKAI